MSYRSLPNSEAWPGCIFATPTSVCHPGSPRNIADWCSAPPAILLANGGRGREIVRTGPILARTVCRSANTCILGPAYSLICPVVSFIAASNLEISRRRSIASALYRPCLNAFLLPLGAPGEHPPCIRHLPLVIGGDWQGLPARVRAPHLFPPCISKCMGLFLHFQCQPLPLAVHVANNGLASQRMKPFFASLFRSSFNPACKQTRTRSFPNFTSKKNPPFCRHSAHSAQQRIFLQKSFW
jgi:hypothetical protein